MTTNLCKFFLNEVPDQSGRYINDMLNEDFDWMEETHDFVQWWFPNSIESRYNPDAPLLTEADTHDIMASTDAKITFMACVKRMTEFFGFKFKTVVDYTPDASLVTTVVKADNFDERKNVLCGEFNHNHLRFTRMLLAMNYFGFNSSAKKLYDAVASETKNDTSATFWSAAVNNVPTS